MIKVSLFPEQERESKLDKIGDALDKLAEQWISRRWPRRSTKRRPGLAASVAEGRRFRPN